MINLLPPTVKEQVRFAKMNRVVLRYVRLLAVVVVILGGIFGATLFYMNMITAQVNTDVTSKKTQIASSAAFSAQAKDISTRLAAIKQIQASQTRFSTLLSDLAKVLPKGVAIDTITLTGDDTKPVRITVSGNTYNSLLAFRDALAGSPRISGADLESISQDTNAFHAGVVLAFKKGQAK